MLRQQRDGIERQQIQLLFKPAGSRRCDDRNSSQSIGSRDMKATPNRLKKPMLGSLRQRSSPCSVRSIHREQ